MATRKGRKGPDIRKYVLTVDARSGKVLHTEIEDLRTGERKPAGKVSFAYSIDPEDGTLPSGPIVAPGTRHNRPVIDARINPVILPANVMKRGK